MKGAVVKSGDSEVPLDDGFLLRVLKRAYLLYERQKTIETELSELKSLIAGRAKEFGEGAVSFSLSGFDLRVKPRSEAYIENADAGRLRDILGRGFYRLVTVKKLYIPSGALLKDGRLNRFVAIKELRPFFKWRKGRGRHEKASE